MRRVFQLLKHGLLAFGIFGSMQMSYAEEIKLGLPINCQIDKDCYIQNLPDILAGKGTADSFCQSATYNGHKGVDIRVLSLKDIERNTPVIAPASGIVKALRDGVEDKLLLTNEDREQVKGTECGNGIVIAHKNGYETQLCHLKQNSIIVAKGDIVEQGDLLGFVGNSGAAEFPHVHLSVRKDGQWIDPVTGKIPSQECSIEKDTKSLFNKNVAKFFTADTSRLITSGITGAAIVHHDLVKIGAPANITTDDKAIVGWGWFINLRKGDQIRFVLEGPKGLISENTTKPLDRNKAAYSAFSGKKQTPVKGEYKLETKLLREGQTIAQSLFVHIIE